MRASFSLALLAIACVLAGCAPIYHPADLNKTVALKGSDNSHLFICERGQWYRLSEDENGFMHIPYGRRVLIENFYVASSPYATTECVTSKSFVPQGGTRYYVNFNQDASSCSLEVMRYTSQGNLAPEPTAQRDILC